MSVPEITEIRSHVIDVLDASGQSVEEVCLFGSQARGEAREDSDIDIALVDSAFEGTPMYKRGVWFKKEWDYLGVGPLELYCLTPSEYEKRLEDGHETVVNIEEEGVSLLDESSC